MTKQTYLGDGLYAEHDGYQVRLYTTNGIRTTNEVFLDDVTLKAFERFLVSLQAPPEKVKCECCEELVDGPNQHWVDDGPKSGWGCP